MRLPTELEINPVPGFLDGDAAVRMFHGKTVDEAELLFRESGLDRQEDLMFMGPVGYIFYFPAALTYLRSSDSAQDADFLSSMVGMMEFRVIDEHNDAEALIAAFPDMLTFCEHALSHYDFYDVDEEIYGDLRPRLQVLSTRLGATKPVEPTGVDGSPSS